MANSLKYALIFGLISSTSLSGYAASNIASNQSISANKHTKTINTPNIKSLKSNIIHEKPNVPVFRPVLVKRVQITLNEQETNLNDVYKDYVGKKITQQELTELSNKITEYYLKQDYLLPHINLSEGALKKGWISIDVEPHQIKDVVIVGEGEKNKIILEYAAKILEEKPAKISTTQKYLALMNKVAGYDVHYQLKQEEGDNFNLVIYTTKKKASVYTGIDNYGINELGKYQASMMAEVYSPFNRGENFMVHGSTTNHPDRLNDYGIGYSQPLNAYGTTGHLFASRSQDNATKQNAISSQSNSGESIRAAVSHHLFIRAHQDLEAELGTSYKKSDTYKVVNNSSTHEKDSKYWSGDVGLKYILIDKLGARNLVQLTYAQGLGGTFKNYLNDAPLPTKHYGLVNLNLYREQPLPYDFSLMAHINMKYSGNTLPDSEKAVLGGRDFGRGYDFGTLDGTKLIATSIEARYTYTLKETQFVEHIQPYVFHDMGTIKKQPSNTNIDKLRSAGFGLRFKLIQNIDFGAEVAEPMKKKYTIEGVDTKAKTKYSFFINKVFEF